MSVDFNIDFEVAALAVLGIIALYFMSYNRVKEQHIFIYKIYMMIMCADILLDLCSIWTIANADTVPLAVNYAVNTGFFMLQSVLSPVFLLFMFSMLGVLDKRNKGPLIAVMVPAIFNQLILLTQPWTDWFFRFTPEGEYTHGPLFGTLYVFAAFYYLIVLGFTYYNRKTLGGRKTCAVYFIIVINLITTSAQAISPQYILTGFGIVLSQLVMMLSCSNPDAYTDALTGALSRKAFISRTTRMTNQQKRFFAIVVAPDHFARVNEVYGTRTGDEVLCCISQYLTQLTGADNVYRFCDDVFIALETEAESARRVVKQIERRTELHWVTAEGIEVSLGACICLLDSEKIAEHSAENMVRFAINTAKSRGRGNHVETDAQLAEQLEKHLVVEREISRSIKEHTADLWFQPIYDVKKQGFHTMEVLVRMNIPGVGSVSPDEFIHIAEQNGTIVPFGMVIIEEAIRFIANHKLEEKGIEYAEINLSVIQCIQEGFAARIIALLEKHGVPPRMINLEVTETADIQREETFRENMTELVKYGVAFSLDDYGTGYSTPSYVDRMHFSLVKIDKNIIWAAEHNERSNIILRAMLDMIQGLGITTLAEGVETEKQEKWLTSLGIDYFQGWLYSKALTQTEFLSFLEEKRSK